MLTIINAVIPKMMLNMVSRTKAVEGTVKRNENRYIRGIIDQPWSIRSMKIIRERPSPT